jgi:hypothetical protein
MGVTRIYAAVRAASSGATLGAPREAQMLDELLEKYREMRELRVHREAGTLTDPRARLRLLAARFPGALREIDERPMAEIDARIDALEVLRGDATRAPAPWMVATYHFHRELRSRLRTKRWLAGRRAVDDALRERFAREHASVPELLRMQDDLAAIAQPAGQRLSLDAMAAAARLASVTVEEAKRLIFGATRR